MIRHYKVFLLLSVFLLCFQLGAADTNRKVFDNVGSHTWTPPDGVEEVDVLVVAGGGSGGDGTGGGGGGGGGGGVALAQDLSISSGSKTIQVGDGGGSGGNGKNNGENSFFDKNGGDEIKAIGGGGGSLGNGGGGASGGSAGGPSDGSETGERDNGLQPGTNDNAQDFGSDSGTHGCNNVGSGGGGAGERGQDVSCTNGDGGDGVYMGDIFGDDVGENGWFGGGGGGGGSGQDGDGQNGIGGRGGGGDGRGGGNSGAEDGIDGTGGGGGGSDNDFGEGGSGIVIIQYDPEANPPSNPSPSDSASDVSRSPTLSVDVSHSDGQSMDVAFYDASDGSRIGTDNGVSSGGTASVEWKGRVNDTSYQWYAVADDGDSTTQSPTWSFTTQSSPNDPSTPSPADEESGVSTSTTLSVEVSDPEGDSMDVGFYSGMDVFTEPGTHSVTVPDGITSAEVLVVGGGGGGGGESSGADTAGGGGGGGINFQTDVSISSDSYTVVVGDGGAGGNSGGNNDRPKEDGEQGEHSYFAKGDSIEIVGYGGGPGALGWGQESALRPTPRGGGGGGASRSGSDGGAPATSQGNAGGDGVEDSISARDGGSDGVLAGGGGAGERSASSDGGDGGDGGYYGDVFGTNYGDDGWFAGGGGGGTEDYDGGSGGKGGGGDANGNNAAGDDAIDGTGGGGGAGDEADGGDGGSGIVIVQWKIGEAENVDDGGTASVDWDNLDSGTEYSWYARARDGEFGTKSSKWNFTTSYSPSIDTITVSDDASDHGFVPDAVVSDPDGASNIDSCSVTVSDGNSNNQPYSTTLDTSFGGSDEAACNVSETVSYVDDGGWGHVETMDIQFSVTDQDGNTGSGSTSHAFPNHQPSITEETSFSDSGTDHAFDLNATATDSDAGSGELSTCTVFHEDQDGNSHTTTGSVDTSYGGTDEAQCTATVDDDYSGYSGTDTLDIQVQFSDQHDLAVNTSETTHQLPNNDPSVTSQPDFVNYSDQHAFNVTAVAEDTDDGQDEIASCTVSHNTSSTSYESDGNLDTGYGTTDQAECSRTIDLEEFSEYSPEEPVTVQITFTDKHGATVETSQATNAIPNDPPTIELDDTIPGGPSFGDDVVVETNVSDQENDTITYANYTIWEYNEDTDTQLIDNENGTVQRGSPYTLWNSSTFTADLQNGTYNWTVEVSDGFATTTQTGTFKLEQVSPTIAEADLSVAAPYDITATRFRPDQTVVAQVDITDLNGRPDLESWHANITSPDGEEATYLDLETVSQVTNGYTVETAYTIDSTTEGDWSIDIGATDTVGLSDSNSTEFTVTQLDNVSVEYSYEPDGGTIETRSSDFHYVVTNGAPLLTGLIQYGDFLEKSGSTNGDVHTVSMAQDFDSRMLLPYTAASLGELDEHEDELSTSLLGGRSFLASNIASIAYEMHDQFDIVIDMSYYNNDQIHLDGFNGSLGAGTHQLVVRNDGVEDGQTVVEVQR